MAQDGKCLPLKYKDLIKFITRAHIKSWVWWHALAIPNGGAEESWIPGLTGETQDRDPI